MNIEDEKWQSLLSRSASTFAGDTTPPYGFLTNTLARLKEEKRLEAEMDKISFRALFASMAALVIMVGITVSIHLHKSNDLEPGMRSLIQVENVQLS